MSAVKHTRAVRCVFATVTATVAVATPAAGEKPGTEAEMGPSTATPPYVVPAARGVRTTSLLSVGDSVAGYRMVGTPDGLGAYRNDGNRFTLLMIHEFNALTGVTRAHGQRGAFVSEWSIDRKSLAVTHGRDLIQPGVSYWDYATGAYSLAPSVGFGAALARFCSGTLSDPGMLLNDASGNGYDGQLYFANEE